jgi:hypothetical protein
MLSATATRRRFLRTAVGLGVWGFLRPTSAWAQRLTPRGSSPRATQLARCFTYKDSAAVVGRAYLQCVPGEADVQLLVDLICVGGAE